MLYNLTLGIRGGDINQRAVAANEGQTFEKKSSVYHSRFFCGNFGSFSVSLLSFLNLPEPSPGGSKPPPFPLSPPPDFFPDDLDEIQNSNKSV